MMMISSIIIVGVYVDIYLNFFFLYELKNINFFLVHINIQNHLALHYPTSNRDPFFIFFVIIFRCWFYLVHVRAETAKTLAPTFVKYKINFDIKCTC